MGYPTLRFRLLWILCAGTVLSVSNESAAWGSKKPATLEFYATRTKRSRTNPATRPRPYPGPLTDYFAQGRVTDTYNSRVELTTTRDPASHRTDSCKIRRVKDTFSEAIGYGVDEGMRPRLQDLAYIASPSYDPYRIRAASPVAISFTSHPMCEVDADDLRVMLSTTSRAPRMPSELAISKINTFVKRYNTLRARSLSGNKDAQVDLKHLWSHFMGCLAYVESLGDADAPRSDTLARKYAPTNYERPRGVNFYYDPGQPIESALNIGLFQFAPGSGGNIQSCIRSWNKTNPACAVPTNAPASEMIRVLGSARQAFNSFCGANMIINTFYVQANTTSAYNTSPHNTLPNGRLKAPSDRCVSLHVRSGRSYNHFGPFHNSTGLNLEKLMTCAASF